MRKLAITVLVLASACASQPAENIRDEAVAPEVPTTAAELTTTSTAPAPTTTTTLAATTTTEPPPVATTYLRPQATTIVESATEWAIPTYIVMCESGGKWDAINASGASGPYQLMPMHFGGELAMNQSRAAQHAKAAELWNGGRGKSHWSACL